VQAVRGDEVAQESRIVVVGDGAGVVDTERVEAVGKGGALLKGGATFREADSFDGNCSSVLSSILDVEESNLV